MRETPITATVMTLSMVINVIITQFASIGIFMLHSGRLYSHDVVGLAQRFSGNHGIPAEFSSDARHALGRADSKG